MCSSDPQNVILLKYCTCVIIRFVDNTSITRGGEGLLHEEPDELITHGCAREEREAGAQGVQVSSESVRTIRSSEFETNGVSTWQLRIKQISTCWKDNFK